MWLARDIEVAGARLLGLVVERTNTQDAWYGTMATVLMWYAESRGYDRRTVEPVINDVIQGRFESWTAPTDEVAAATWAELGARLAATAPRNLDADLDDATKAWWKSRENAFASFEARPPVWKDRPQLTVDGHRRYIEMKDRKRDAERADAMDVALDACRASAAAGEPLTFELLAKWQTIVLGRGERDAPDFRSTDAFAKKGRERYPRGDDQKLRERFDRCLREANDAAQSPLVRAARVFLDVCFVHPFEDGNGRAARLAMDHVLTRAGLGLMNAEPIFAMSRSSSDVNGAWHFVQLVNHLVAPV